MSCKIPYWYGRVGNNLQQITNALYFGITNHRKVECSQPHTIFNPFSLDFSNAESKEKNNSFECAFFYYRESKQVETELPEFSCDPDDVDKNRSYITKHYVRNLLNFNLDEIEPYDQHTVVIHIRSGDIFEPNPHNCYVTNPLSFYLKVIQAYDKAIVVTENPNNFLVKELIKLKNVEVKSSDVKSDFITLLKASSLCSSGVGTFPIAAALLSKNIKKLHCTNLYLDNHLNPEMVKHDQNVEVIMTHVNEQEYIKIGQWDCSAQQIEKILHYQV